MLACLLNVSLACSLSAARCCTATSLRLPSCPTAFWQSALHDSPASMPVPVLTSLAWQHIHSTLLRACPGFCAAGRPMVKRPCCSKTSLKPVQVHRSASHLVPSDTAGPLDEFSPYSCKIMLISCFWMLSAHLQVPKHATPSDLEAPPRPSQNAC